MTRISKFGKQESLESSQESWKFHKDSESHQRKSVVSDPLGNLDLLTQGSG